MEINFLKVSLPLKWDILFFENHWQNMQIPCVSYVCMLWFTNSLHWFYTRSGDLQLYLVWRPNRQTDRETNKTFHFSFFFQGYANVWLVWFLCKFRKSLPFIGNFLCNNKRWQTPKHLGIGCQPLANVFHSAIHSFFVTWLDINEYKLVRKRVVAKRSPPSVFRTTIKPEMLKLKINWIL